MPTGKMIETKIFLRNVSPLKMVSMVSKNNVSNPLIYIKKIYSRMKTDPFITGTKSI